MDGPNCTIFLSTKFVRLGYFQFHEAVFGSQAIAPPPLSTTKLNINLSYQLEIILMCSTALTFH